MANQFFNFKHFSVKHDRCAMKVGTDGVLLGAWSKVCHKRKVLDVGAGSGLLSLMIAQRNKEAFVTALEIEQQASGQAIENIQNSAWKDRIVVVNSSLQNFSTDEKFDLIVSNPPFFSASKANECQLRTVARHDHSLNVAELMYYSSLLAARKAGLSVIYPYQHRNMLFEAAADNSWFPEYITHVCPKWNYEPVRILAHFTNYYKPANILNDHLFIEKENRHDFTDEYKTLTKDFYLAF
jgi:tRNA1Val (adenine37-N6)-methyltransferase